ncbi:MAG: thioredoxin family protein [Puniceicoccaceae bacterium]
MNSIRKITIGIALLSLAITSWGAVPDGWTSDYEEATATAETEDRLVLLMFTGSDWCVWCKRVHQEILDTPVFMEWAKENLVLVYVDFPRKDYRTAKVKEQNDSLDKQYDVSGYPTMVLTDPAGEELKRLSYMQGGPKTFIRAIQRARKGR